MKDELFGGVKSQVHSDPLTRSDNGAAPRRVMGQHHNTITMEKGMRKGAASGV
jgi:hypothetical protein